MRDIIEFYDLLLVVKISLGIRLPGGDGFMISHHEIIPTGEENLAGLEVLYNKLEVLYNKLCDCKLHPCQYFSDTNTVYCMDENGDRRLEVSSSTTSSFFMPFILLKYLL